MKKLLLAFLLGAFVCQTYGAESQWTTSLPKALAKAKKENKLVLMDFTGSDWCVWCHKLDEETFSKPAFLNYAKKNLVLVEVDFPAKKQLADDVVKANDELKSKYQIEGFPTLIALNSDGSVAWKNVGYLEGGPSAIIKKLDDAKKK